MSKGESVVFDITANDIDTYIGGKSKNKDKFCACSEEIVICGNWSDK